jgi:hypothetical protein
VGFLSDDDRERLKPSELLPHETANNAKLYGIEPKKAELDFKNDKLTALKAKYDKAGREPSNLRYGYVAEPISDFSVFG